MDDMDNFLFLFRGGHHLQQIGESHNGIQGRANLMCHIGEEHTLQSSRLISALRFLFQVLLFLHQLVYVTPYTECSLQFALFVVFWDTVDLYPLGFDVTAGHHGIHTSHITQWFGYNLCRITQLTYELIVLIDEDALQLLQCKLVINST